MKVGITGATGFIGGAVVPRFAKEGWDLVLLDNRSGPLAVESPEWPVENLDFSTEEGVRHLSDCDVVVHLGAVSGVMACAENPEETRRVNVGGTGRLVEGCAARHIPLAFASSMAVVGKPARLPVTETTPARPTHEYGRQKAEGERIVSSLAEKRAASSAVVRMSNVYGVYRRGGRTIAKPNVISLFVAQAAQGELRVNAPGTQRRNFIHIEDVVAHWVATVRFLLDQRSPSTQVFNCVSDESYSILELAGRVARLWKDGHPNTPDLRVQLVPNPRSSVEILDPEFHATRERTHQLLGIGCRRGVEETLRSLLAP